jgi:hypothetical protein
MQSNCLDKRAICRLENQSFGARIVISIISLTDASSESRDMLTLQLHLIDYDRPPAQNSAKQRKTAAVK